MKNTEGQIPIEKNLELRQLVEELRLIDDTFFEKVMEDRETCEEVIRIIMGDPKLSVKEVNPQEPIHNLQGRSVRLDALCKKNDGNYINIEIQRADNDNHFKRVRYNASCITANITDPGERFKNVKDVCVIYISEFDMFKRRKTIYHIRHVVQETENEENPIYIDDGFTSIYVNTAVDDNTEIAELMGCFLQTKIDNPKFPKLSNRVTQFKETEEGVMEMCATVEKYAEKYAKKYADKREAERIVRTVNSLIKKHNFSFQDACQAAHITMKGYEKYRQIAMPDSVQQKQKRIKHEIK